MQHIVIIGVGALGSHVLQFIRNFDAKITVVDFDKIEQKNVQAQFHAKMSLRRNKAQAIQQAMRGMFGTTVAANVHKVTVDNIDAICGSATLILDCTDNIAARRLIQCYAEQSGTPTLHGCLSATGDFARIVWTEDFVPDPEGTEGEATCEGGEQLPFYGYAGAQIALIAQRFIKTGKKHSFQLVASGLTRL